MKLDAEHYNSFMKSTAAVMNSFLELGLAVLLSADIGRVRFELSPTGHEKVAQFKVPM